MHVTRFHRRPAVYAGLYPSSASATRPVPHDRQANAESAALDTDFWADFDGLDREVVIAETLALLKAKQKPLSIAELAKALPPTHDLETFALWITMAREAGIDIVTHERETVDIIDKNAKQWRFTLPVTKLDEPSLANIEWEI